jgi:diguanylate cyclase
MERALREAPAYLPAEASFALIDVDHFKDVNDRYGHIVGDRVLARLAGMFTRGTRPTDLVARVGGEEFAVLLADEHWGDLAPGLGVTVSIGIVPLHPGESLTVALERADRPLYEAKRGGRNRIAVAG